MLEIIHQIYEHAVTCPARIQMTLDGWGHSCPWVRTSVSLSRCLIKMPVPTVSKLPEMVIFGDPLPKSRFSAVSATVFYTNRVTGNIWPRVHGLQWYPYWNLHFFFLKIYRNIIFLGKIDWTMNSKRRWAGDS